MSLLFWYSNKYILIGSAFFSWSTLILHKKCLLCSIKVVVFINDNFAHQDFMYEAYQRGLVDGTYIFIFTDTRNLYKRSIFAINWSGTDLKLGNNLNVMLSVYPRRYHQKEWIQRVLKYSFLLTTWMKDEKMNFTYFEQELIRRERKRLNCTEESFADTCVLPFVRNCFC